MLPLFGMTVIITDEFKRVYAEWVYREGTGQDGSAYVEAVVCLWDAMDPFTREAVREEILTIPQVVETQFIVGPTTTHPMKIEVKNWVLPGVEDLYCYEHPEDEEPVDSWPQAGS